MSEELVIEVLGDRPIPVHEPPGRQRLRKLAGLIVVASVLVAAGAGYGLDRLLSSDPRAGVVAAFAGLQPVGAPVPLTDGGGVALDVVDTWIVGDRAVAIGQTPGLDLWVAGMNLTTGQAAWPPRNLGLHGYRLSVALPQGIAVVADELGENWLFVLDPETGRPRWQAVIDAPVLPYRDVLVVGDNARGMLRGLDWDTGQPRWLTPMRSTSTYLPSSAITYPRAFGMEPGSVPLVAEQQDPPDDRFFEVGTDGTVATYDARTGDRSSIRANVVPAGPRSKPVNYRVYGDVLYQLGRDVVTGHDLTGTGPPRALYTADGSEEVNWVAPCGAGRVCVDTIDGDHGELVLVDLATGHQLWRRPTKGIGPSIATSDRILTQGTDVFDPDGRSLLAMSDSTAAWAGGNRLLLMAVNGSARDLFDVNASTGATRRLGAIDEPAGDCVLNSHALVCPIAGHLQEWTFP